MSEGAAASSKAEPPSPTPDSSSSSSAPAHAPAPASEGDAQLQQQGKQPCFLNALSSAVPAGMLGWVFGLLPSMARNRSFSMSKTWMTDASLSAQNLAKFSGTYAFAHCLLTRVRQVDDAFNRGAAGCATGLAVGFSAGPSSALNSCIGIGFLSYIIDMPANAALSCCSGCSSHAASASGLRPACGGAAAAPKIGCNSSSSRAEPASHSTAQGSRRMRGASGAPPLSPQTSWLTSLQGVAVQAAAQQQQLPPVMWLGAVCNGLGGCSSAYFEPAPWEHETPSMAATSLALRQDRRVLS